jgi:hypothetical protein
MLKGACVLNVWQPMSADTCVSPISGERALRIFMALKTGRSGHPVQNEGGRLAIGCGRTSRTRAWCSVRAAYRSSMAAAAGVEARAAVRKARRPALTRAGTYSPCGEKTSLPWISTGSRASCAMAFSSRSMWFGMPSSTTSTRRLPRRKPMSSSGTSGWMALRTISGTGVRPYTSARPSTCSPRTVVFHSPPCITMPRSSSVPRMCSLSPCSTM